MKKTLLLITFIASLTIGAFAQSAQGEKSIIIQGGVKSNPGRFMLGAEGRYAIVDNLRIAPDIYFVFPKNKVTGLDVDVNLHYAFNLDAVTPDLSLYPLLGLSMQNTRYSGNHEHKSKGFTQWGFNLGAGIDYGITSNTYLNLEMKYTFSDWDNFNLFFGYGIKF